MILQLVDLNENTALYYSNDIRWIKLETILFAQEYNTAANIPSVYKRLNEMLGQSCDNQ